MLLLRSTSTPRGVRPPLIEPVTTLPGLPAMPGEVRHPVPALAARLHRPLPIG